MKLEAESIAHGGETVARHEGRVVFLSGAAPGDLVEAEIIDDSRVLRARTLRVLQAGPARVGAPCPIVDRCGGCPLQVTAYAAQLAAKEELLADALERIGGIARGAYELRPIVPSPYQFQYRRRARLHRIGSRWGFSENRTSDSRASGAPHQPAAAAVRRQGDTASGGWAPHESRLHRSPGAIVPIDACLLFEPALQALADRIGELPFATDVALLAGERHGAIDIAGKVTRAQIDALLKDFRGVTSHGAVYGDPVIADPPLANGARLRSRPDTFAQANRAMVPLLQAEVLRLARDARNLLELFCGSGTLTLPLLDNNRSVTAVEFAGPSLQLLRKSADEARLAVKLIGADAGKLQLSGAFDTALLDPPRTGAAHAVQMLAGMGIPRIIYVSCDAPTLARDARLLSQRGYALIESTPLDLFPQTAHFESVSLFTRGVP